MGYNTLMIPPQVWGAPKHPLLRWFLKPGLRLEATTTNRRGQIDASQT